MLEFLQQFLGRVEIVPDALYQVVLITLVELAHDMQDVQDREHNVVITATI